jgi:hypothetical protein
MRSSAPALGLLALVASARLAAAQCDRPASCIWTAQPPGACTTDLACPLLYGCVGGECRAGPCDVKADCPADGQCVHTGGAAEGVCVCRGCGEWDCTLGCSLGGILNGCRCNMLDDCPSENDVCFLGLCS